MWHIKINIANSSEKCRLSSGKSQTSHSLNRMMLQPAKTYPMPQLQLRQYAQKTQGHPITRKILAMQVAFYRYHFLQHPIIVDDIVANITSGFQKISSPFKNCGISQLRGFFEQKQKNLNQLLANEYLQSITFLLKKEIQQIRSKCEGFSTKQLTMRVINILSHFFKTNFEYSKLMGQQQQTQLLSQADLLKIFKCSEQYFQFLLKNFRENINYIDKCKLLPKQSELISSLILIKLKMSIMMKLKLQTFPLEEQIQEALQNIKKFYNNKGPKLNKQPLSSFTKLTIDGTGKSIKLRENVRYQLKQLCKNDISESNLKSYLFKIHDKFNVSVQLLRNQYHKIKNNQKLSIQKFAARKKQIMQLFNYYMYKTQIGNVVDIRKIITQKHSLASKWLLQMACEQQIINLRRMQYRNYQKILFKMFERYYQLKQILFIDHIQFYRKQFHLYNKIIKNIQTQNEQYCFNTQIQDTILQLITGLTTKGILFYQIVEDKLRFSSYIDKIIQIFDSLHGKLPKAVVMYFSPSFLQSKLKNIQKLVTLLQKRGTTLFILPVSYKIINPNKRIQLYLKKQLLNRISHEINNPNFIHQALLELQSLLQMISEQFDQHTIECFWKKSKNCLFNQQL